MTTEDLFWLSINAYHEARGEIIEGKIAICHVVFNRAKSKKKSIKEVVLQPYQFSWANGGGDQFFCGSKRIAGYSTVQVEPALTKIKRITGD